MSKDQLYDIWWKDGNNGEQRMEEEHQRHWEKVLQMVEEKELKDCNVLDFGCNQGGFLRYLYHKRPFNEGIGVDLAQKSIEIANARKDKAPLTYFATAEPEQFAHHFDLAFSISVIYLIKDLKDHARKMKMALKPGGVYYSTFTDYVGNPSLPTIKYQIDQHGMLGMNLHALDEIANAFLEEGFEVEIQRMLPHTYIPLSKEDRWFFTIKDRMQYEYEQAYIFRFIAPRT